MTLFFRHPERSEGSRASERASLDESTTQAAQSARTTRATQQLKMSRIVIVGCAGGGKTTFAHQLAERTGAPMICLDAIWQPDWTKDDVPAFRTLMKDAHAGETWISDGNFALATFDIRLPRATLVIWLDRPKLSCAWRAITRVFQPGEPHRIGALAKVLRFVWNFDQINRPLIEAQRIAHGRDVQVVRLKNNREIAAFLSAAQTPRDIN
jgi:adenylate kinase family enzyme